MFNFSGGPEKLNIPCLSRCLSSGASVHDDRGRQGPRLVARPRPALRGGTGGPAARAEHPTRAALYLAAAPAGRGPLTWSQ
jgi:hypothetical protein